MTTGHGKLAHWREDRLERLSGKVFEIARRNYERIVEILLIYATSAQPAASETQRRVRVR